MMPLLTPTAPHLATSTANHSHTPGQVTAVSSTSVGNSRQVSHSVAQKETALKESETSGLASSCLHSLDRRGTALFTQL